MILTISLPAQYNYPFDVIIYVFIVKMNHVKNICRQLNFSEEREQSKKRFALPSRGKVLCEALKEVRRRIAEENDIPLEIEECTYKGECLGTCPRCEAEVRYLENTLAERIKLGKVATVAGLALGLAAPGAATAQDTISTKNAENIPIIEIPSGEYFMGYISDDPQKLENIPVDTLPTVLPIHKSVSLNATGKIKGLIKDQDGNPVPYANVLLYKDGEENFFAKEISDSTGNYLIEGLDPGTYDMKVSSVGYRLYEKVGIKVKETGFTLVDLQLMSLDAPLPEEIIIGMSTIPMIELDPIGPSQQMEREGVKVIVR